jgi:hypothetical protein
MRRSPVTGNRNALIAVLILSLLVCGYDFYAAVRGGGHNVIAWLLGGIMAIIALGALRKLIRNDYSNSWW